MIDESVRPLDIRYVRNPRVMASIRTADTLTIVGASSPFELPVAFFHVLMAFAQPRTPREAFATLDVDVDLGEFGTIVEELAQRDLLRPEQPAADEPDLRQLLNPAVRADPRRQEQIAGWLQQGRAILVTDALPAQLAEDVHRDLCQASQWNVIEGGHDYFHFRNSVLSPDGQTPALTECSRLFKSAATRRFVAELSGQDCAGDASVAAAWYRPNEYALPHDDSAASDPRSVAYIWYLTKDWKREWGGALFWCPTGQYINPTFNLLVMFRVMSANVHFVCPVAASATGRRLTINGFWNRAQRGAQQPPPPDAMISPRAYGPLPPDGALGPIIVL